MTQRKSTLSMLRKGPVTTSEFLEAGIPRFSARVQELRDEGHIITTSRIGDGRYRYRLIPSELGVEGLAGVPVAPPSLSVEPGGTSKPPDAVPSDASPAPVELGVVTLDGGESSQAEALARGTDEEDALTTPPPPREPGKPQPRRRKAALTRGRRYMVWNFTGQGPVSFWRQETQQWEVVEEFADGAAWERVIQGGQGELAATA